MATRSIQGIIRAVSVGPRPIISFRRLLCDSAEPTGEERISQILKSSFSPTHVQVDDISGGCGSMYEINITSEAFRGKRQVEQHKMVNKALAEEIKSMHGLRIATSVPES